MTVIKQDDLIDSIADALQYISYFHPLDFIRAMDEAYQREQNPAARDAIAQILINSPHVCHGASTHLPGHWNCYHFFTCRYECAMAGRYVG